MYHKCFNKKQSYFIKQGIDVHMRRKNIEVNKL